MRTFKYRKEKARAREQAIEMQRLMSECSMSYGAVAYYQDKLKTLGKRYGLLKEFRENGVI